jgi:hypothetical protein
LIAAISIASIPKSEPSVPAQYLIGFIYKSFHNNFLFEIVKRFSMMEDNREFEPQ